MWIVVAPDAPDGAVVGDGATIGARLVHLADDGALDGSPYHVKDLLTTVRDAETKGDVRWVWPSTADLYPHLLAAGVTVSRCHDLELVEALLLGSDGRWGAPRGLAAAWARLS